MVKQQKRYWKSVTVEEKALPAEWFLYIPVENFYLNTEDFGAPSVEELDKVVRHIRNRIDSQKPVPFTVQVVKEKLEQY